MLPPQRLARASAAADLPLAVGPAMRSARILNRNALIL
jgi:hypothetical protein